MNSHSLIFFSYILLLLLFFIRTAALHASWVAQELKVVRNTHASFHLPGGCMTGMMYSGISCFVLKGREPWTFANHTPDSDRTRPAAEFKEIQYHKPDGVLSFDLLTNLQRSGESLGRSDTWVFCNL